MTQRALPLLDDIRVASPCPVAWASMRGDDRVRRCDQCDRDVYDLSALTRAQAEALVAGREGRLCVRFYRRADGTVLTADCPVGVRRRRWVAFSALAVGTLAAVAGLFAALAAGEPTTATPITAEPTTLATAEPAPSDTAEPAPPDTAEPAPTCSAAMVYEPPPVVLSSFPVVNPPPPRAAKGAPTRRKREILGMVDGLDLFR